MARSVPQPAAAQPAWLGLVKFLILVASMVFLFVMGQTMVRHHFFNGGALNYRMSQPPADH